MKRIRLDQKVQIQLDLYNKDFHFTFAAIVFVVMLLTFLRAPIVLFDSLALELPLKLQLTFSGSYVFDMPSSSSRRTLNKMFFISKNTKLSYNIQIVLSQGTHTQMNNK